MKLTINNFRTVMEKKARARGGVYENFGRDEISKLRDQYPDMYGADREAHKQLDALQRWAEEYTGV